MDAKYIERLEQVVRVLVELPPEKKFRLNSWMICDTTACAGGWAGMDPWFRRRGFKTKKHRNVYSVECQGLYSVDACKVFFGLTRNQAHHLFMPHQYGRDKSKRAVTRRLKALIREKRDAA